MMNENKLEELKDERELKSKDVAEYLKVNESTYSEWEHNKIPIPTRRLVQLSNFYKVNIDYILKLSNIRKDIKVNNDLDLALIGKRIKEIRTDLNLSLRGLGEKLNCSFSSLGSYERAENLINCEILINLSLVSKCSIDWILGRTDNKYLK